MSQSLHDRIAELEAEVAALREAGARESSRTQALEVCLAAAEADARRYRLAVQYEDNAGLLYSAAINHCPDKDAIDAEFDAEAIEVKYT